MSSFYDNTCRDLWRRSNGDYIRVSEMNKFHLINAAKKLNRLELTHLSVYDGIVERLSEMRKPEETYEFELGGAL